MTKECWVSEWWWLTVNVQWVSEWQWHGHFLCNVVFSDRAGKSVFLAFVFKLWKFVQAILSTNRNLKQEVPFKPQNWLQKSFCATTFSWSVREGGGTIPSRGRRLARGVPTLLVHTGYHHLGVHNPRITKLLHNCSTPWLPQIHEQDCGEGHTNNQ